jgi:mutator protein MutT
MTSLPYGVAVRALLLDENGKSLLLRRSYSSRHFAGMWEWPGGKCDPGETIDKALMREVEEETGLQIEVTDFIGADDFVMSEIHVVSLYMKAEIVEGVVTLSGEHDDFSWVFPEDYSEVGLADNTRSFMLDYWKKKGTEK